MALFKIKKGVKANLPTSYVEGYCYFTTDDGKFYIDTSNEANGRICLNAGQADRLTSNAGSATQPVYFSEGKPVAITGSIANNITGNASTATKLATARTIALTGSVTGSGTFDGSGNLSITTTTNHTHDYAAASHTHSYLPLSGGTMTGNILIAAGGAGGKINGSATNGGINSILIGDDVWLGDCNVGGTLGLKSNNNAQAGFSFFGSDGTNFGRLYYDSSGGHSTSAFYGAVWNDYAEFRICNEDFKPGQVVLENGDDTLSITNQRLQRGCSIISDTFGFAIGETDEAKCPIAVSGRVLAYPFEPIEEFRNHIGYPVCSGPNGTVSIMTEEEEEKYPSRIIGTISAIPDYKTWGSGNVEVKNRVWIKVK